MLSRDIIITKGFTFFRRIEGDDNYTGGFNVSENRDEYLGHVLLNGKREILLFQNFDDGRVAILKLYMFINTHWNNEYIFTGEIKDEDTLDSVLTKLVGTANIKPITFT